MQNGLIDSALDRHNHFFSQSVAYPMTNGYYISELNGDDVAEFFQSQKGIDLVESINTSRLSLSLACAWYMACTANSDSRAILVSKDNNTVALMLVSTTKSGPFTLIRAPRYDLFPESIDVMFTNSALREEVIELLAKWLRDRRIIIDIDAVRPDAAILEIARLGMKHVITEQSVSGREILSMLPVEEYLSSTSRSFRSSVFRTIKRMKQMSIRKEIITERNVRLIEKMFELHRLQFRENSEFTTRIDDYRRIIYTAIENSCGYLLTYFDKDQPIAVDLWIDNAGSSYLINGGRDISEQYKGIGTYMMIEGVNDAFQRGAQRVLLMRPDSQLKQKMGGEEIEYQRLRCAPGKFSWIMYRAFCELEKIFRKNNK